MTDGDDLDDDRRANALGHAFGSPPQETTRDSRPLERIGAFELIEEIGRGGQGIVYRARDTKHGRDVALKVLPPAAQPSAAMLARFRREAQVAARLSHPGICAIYDSGFFGGGAWIAMQLVTGRSLAEVLRKDAGGDRLEMLSLVERVARAAHAAHEAGVIHRDLKPGNLMIGANGDPVILDFGLARDLEEEGPSLTMTGEMFGTLAYMSPEQLAEDRVRIDRRTDVFSLGVVLYECLTRTRPFQGPTRESQMRAILGKDPPDPRRIDPGIGRDLAAVLECALEKDRNRRYQTALDFAEELRRVREHQPVRARRAGPVLKLRRWAQRNPAVAALSATVFAALVVGLAVSLHYMNAARTSLSEFERLADARRLDNLVLEARTGLWPAVPEHVAAMDAWLGRARDLARRSPAHEATLATLRARALPDSAQRREADGRLHAADRVMIESLAEERRKLAGKLEKSSGTEAPWQADARERVAGLDRRLRALQEEVDRRSTWEFEDDRDQWRHDQEARFLDGMRAFLSDDPSGDTIRGVEARRAAAASLRKATIEDQRTLWAEASARIAANRLYPGLALEPQLGLVPVGPDPVSNLEEFAHALTGEVPERDAATGRLRVDSRTAVLLVLLPRLRFRLGAQSTDEDAPNFDRQADRRESPAEEVALDPFFISKYEMTQGQWLRAAGDNPSNYGPGAEHGQKFVGLLNPVEQVSAEDCDALFARLGLLLPTEAQWECAARAGTTTPWWCGRESAEIAGAGNLADSFCKRNGGHPGWRYESWDDGAAIHAPVGSYAPNAFGLHDVLGNVWEWCRDGFGGYDLAADPGDGMRHPPILKDRVYRGGSWNLVASQARSAARASGSVTNKNGNLGVRPSRALVR